MSGETQVGTGTGTQAGTGTAGGTVKPGYRTSEFWLSAGATVVGLVIASGALPETGVWGKVVALVTAAFTALGYTVSRGLAKRG